MQTFKYIVKRILLAILILFGVSVIIYSLARMMPTDFIDNQYQSAIQNGTMTQGDVDRIKEIYGLAMPDAYLSVTPGEDSAYAGVKFTKKTRAADKETVDAYKVTDENGKPYEGNMPILREQSLKWYSGSYEAKGLRLYLHYTAEKNSSAYSKNFTYEIYTVKAVKGPAANGEVDDDEEENDDVLITMDEELELQESGRFDVTVDVNDIRDLQVLTMTRSGSTRAVEAGMDYRPASFFNKAGAVLGGYFTWLFNLLKGDLGMSFKYKKPVGSVIVQNMGISFGIALVATVLQFLIAIPLGIKAATKQYGAVDYTVTVLSMIGISLPTFFLAALFIRVFAVGLGWFPVQGAISSLPVTASFFTRMINVIWHMVLPMSVLVILSIGGLMRYTRTNTLEVLNADYIRTARAKGLSERTVVYKHAFRNTLIPLVTMLAGILPSLFGGAMITETVFSIPGIGKIAYDALVVADVPFIMGYNMFIAILTVVGTLLSDLMYALVDPRVKIGK